MNKVFNNVILCLFLLSCNPKGSEKSAEGIVAKERSSVITIDSNLLSVSVTQKTIESEKLIIELTYTNQSKQPLFLPKSLVADTSISENIFAIIEEKSLDNVGFNNRKKNIYLPIMPGADRANFIALEPGSAIARRIDLFEYYNFKPFIRKGQYEFLLRSNVSMPRIDNNFHQEYRLDKEDSIVKRVYYLVYMMDKKNDPYDVRVRLRR